MASIVTPAESQSTIFFNAQGVPKPDAAWPTMEDPGPTMVETAKSIAKDGKWRAANNLRLARLFEDRPLASVYSSKGSSAMMDEIITPQRTSWNLCRMACQVAQSRVGRARGRVMFVSVDGNWSLRRKARLRTRFIDGAFRQAKIYEEASLAFLDACVFGVGIVYVFSDAKGKLRSERVLPDEIIVDAGAGLHRRPRTLFRRKLIQKSEAIRLYAGEPGDKDYERKCKAINGASCMSSTGIDRGAKNDLCDLYSGWCLPNEADGKGGRLVVAVDSCTLYEEEWKRSRLPFAFFRWELAISGFFGLGLVEQLRGRQLAIRRLLHMRDVSTYHMAAPKILAPVGAKINAKHVNNDLRGTIITYSGAQPPQFIVPQAVSPEIYQQLSVEWSQGMEEVGLPAGGTGAPPVALKSGEAIRNWTESVDARLAMPAQRWDQFFVDLAEILLDEAAEREDVIVEAKVGRGYQRINWKDVAEGEDEIVLQAWPSSLLPASPSGKYDRLADLTAQGWIDKDQAMSMLDLPDLESFLGLSTSSFELLSRHLELMLDEGKPQQPDEYQDLNAAIKVTQAAVLKAKCDGCPEDRLEMTRDYLDAAREMLQNQAPPAPPPGAPPVDAGAPPPGMEAAPPPGMEPMPDTGLPGLAESSLPPAVMSAPVMG